jgi:uncharacterized protein (DUF3084 family)
MKKTTSLTMAAALCAALGFGTVHAADSLEDRLRAQLRSTTEQLQALQTQQAQVNAAKMAAESQRDAAQAETKKLRDDLAKATGQATQLAEQQDKIENAARGQLAEAGAQLGKYKQAYDELLKLARAKEAERATVQTSLGQRDAQLAMCTNKNKEIYAAGKEILTAYEGLGSGDLFKIRQPFSESARVKFDQSAQDYGDKLYNGQYDPRMPVPGAKAAAAPAQSSAAAPATAPAAK